MLCHRRIDLSERTDLTKSTDNKECIFCHYWFLNHELKFQNSDSNGCHDLTMLCLSLSDIAINTIKGVDYPCIIHCIKKSEPTHLLKKSLLDCMFLSCHGRVPK